MHDIRHSVSEDGEPFVTVTLNAADVNRIYSALHRHHDEYVTRVTADGSIEREGVRNGVLDSATNLGRWETIDDTISVPFWEWVNDMEDSNDNQD